MFNDNYDERDKYRDMYQENTNLINGFTNKLFFCIQFLNILLFITNIWQLGNAKKILAYMGIPYIETLAIFIIFELIAFTFLVMIKIHRANPLMGAVFMFSSILTLMELMKIGGVSAVISGDRTIGFNLFVSVSTGIGLYWLILVLRVVMKYKKGYYSAKPELDRNRIKRTWISIAIWCFLAIPIIPFGSYYFRTRGINEMKGNIGAILGLYLIIYLFCVIIFTYLARNVVFIILETRTLLRKRKCSGISE